MTGPSPTPAKAAETETKTTALREALDSLDGWQLVPVTPTTEMRRAMARACTLGWDIGDNTHEQGLAVAPASPLPALLADIIASHAAEIQAREAEIARLKAERDEYGEHIIDLEHTVFHAHARADRLAAENAVLTTPRPLAEYHEDHGSVLWWILPVCEPPYSGSPLCDDWPEYHTHWTPLPKIQDAAWREAQEVAARAALPPALNPTEEQTDG